MATHTDSINETNKFKDDNIFDKQTHVIDLEKDDILTESFDINLISNLHVYDEVGNRHTMGDIWAEFTTIFIFIRVNILLLMNRFI